MTQRFFGAGVLAAAVLVTPGANAGADDQKDSLGLGSYALSLGGQYRVMGDASNFGFHQDAITAERPDGSFVNQRLRTWLNLHDREKRDHGVYLQLEIGHVAWGDDFDFPKTYEANGSEVGLELRRGYLWYKPSDGSLLRVGILDWHDRFGERPTFSDPMWAVDAYDSFRAPLANSIWDFNVGGATFDFDVREKWHLGLGAMVLQKGDRKLTGDGGALLLTADADREVGGALWGGSVYYVRDRGGYSYGDFGGPATPGEVAVPSWDLWAGLRAHFGSGRLRSSFFGIVNTGRVEEPAWEHTGWAVKGGVDYDTGKGKLSAQALYSTGDDGSSTTSSGEFRTIAQSVRDDAGAQSYWSLLGLTSPRGPSDVNDLGVGLQNRGLGLLTVQAGFERSLSASLQGYVSAGWLRSAETNPRSGSKAMGVELLGELHWTVAGALGLDVGASYLWTGDFFKVAPGAASPANLYQLYARFQLEL